MIPFYSIQSEKSIHRRLSPNDKIRGFERGPRVDDLLHHRPYTVYWVPDKDDSFT